MDINSSYRKIMIWNEWRKHLTETADPNVQLSEDTCSGNVTIPGLNFRDFDHYGNPSIFSLMHVAIIAQDLIFYHRDTSDSATSAFLKWDDLMMDRILFTAACKFSISRTMYNPYIPKWSIASKVSLEHVGSTSALFAHQFFLPGTQEPCLTRLVKLVSINKQTRRPLQLPDWFRHKWSTLEKKKSKNEFSDFRLNTFPRPAHTFVHRLTVMFSETDERKHVNFISYVKYGLDTLHLAMLMKSRNTKLYHPKAEGSINGVSSLSQACSDVDKLANSAAPTSIHDIDNSAVAVEWLTEGIMSQGIKALEIVYFKECVEGDEVDVHIWQEKGAEFSVKCSVEGMNETVLCQFTLEFFAPSHNL